MPARRMNLRAQKDAQKQLARTSLRTEQSIESSNELPRSIKNTAFWLQSVNNLLNIKM